MPNNPATIIFNIMDTAMIIERFKSLNHKNTITELIIAKIIPFKIPIANSFETVLLIFVLDNSCVAIALIVTANVCIPALPPIDATIGIRNANATICSIVAPKILITHVAKKAVNKFKRSQLNLLFVFLNIPSVISSSPTPASLNTSSSAYSLTMVKISSLVIIPTNLLFLSTTPAEVRL